MALKPTALRYIHNATTPNLMGCGAPLSIFSFSKLCRIGALGNTVPRRSGTQHWVLYSSEKENDSMDHKIVGNGSADIIHEIEKLKLDKKEIENRISKLEAQLKADEAVQIKANQACSSYDSILDGHAVSSNGLTPGMIYRYSRHLLLPDFGVEGQISLAKSSILVVGAGGLGSPVVLYLASCGIGCIGIVDSDIVELNNLHRQIIHPEAYVGHAKVKSAAAACRAYVFIILELSILLLHALSHLQQLFQHL
ncbi:hypothetical protein IEQ34_012746 [Dendrobium chrysotoxum]|uniref:THIF-type NAD/FAD binding fold domain-containing protein n=1 Tax=Dendrobium chrysotoxum TaxID=161865 RepID=A0AAV7GMQ8_DENCH|nr:hypothetical protein IEQ34_012746 [Dendrobium chrysotoxum]